jgi:hypothetical protein
MCSPVASSHSRVREARMAAKLDEWASQGLIPKYTHWNKTNSFADPVQCGRYRVDFVFELEAGVLLLEYDEGMHTDRNKRCELVRQAEVSIGYGDMPVHWIRFNPDDFKVVGAIQPVTSKERDQGLLSLIQNAVKTPDYDNLITVDYMCYDKPIKDAGSDLVKSFKFKSIHEYSLWVNAVAPETPADPGTGTGGTA